MGVVSAADPDFPEALSRTRAGLARRLPRRLEVPGYRRAAVLVALLDRAGGPTVLFTRRAAALPHHGGEISFPGGGLAAGESPEDGALREAEEEVGLPRGSAEVLGRLDDLVSVARFLVTPVVAAVARPPAAFAGDPGEVEEPFELPLRRLLDPALRRATPWDPALLPSDVVAEVRRSNLRPEDVDPATGHWLVWSFHADETRVVWGLTGRVLAELIARAF